ncbi:MAG: T9SS type A sorting domain-containing protein [Chitinophagales bacterium]|nr:T9SS type A sorting domain-containing protein [Chitinophagales bacterium]
MKTTIRSIQPCFCCFSVILLLTSFHLRAQVTIPDAGFRYYLNQTYPGILQGSILDTTNPTVVGLRKMSITSHPSQNITNITGIEYFRNLDTLTLVYSPVTYLPVLPSISYFMMQAVDINDSITTLPSSLKSLEISFCHAIPYVGLPDSIETVNIYESDSLSNFSQLPATLNSLSVSYSKLDTLPPLPMGLEVLSIGHSQIRHLPILPSGLKRLGCSVNPQLAMPGSLPPTLEWFWCNDNHWGDLPPLPNTLRELNARNNDLTAIAYFPDSLRKITLNDNQLTELPTLPKYLTQLWLRRNQLTCLPALPEGITSLTIGENNITCVPYALEYGNCDSCRYKPKCDDASPCQYAGIRGNFYYDARGNCHYDSLETPVTGYLVLMDSSYANAYQHDVLPDSTGYYRVDLPQGRYSIVYTYLWPPMPDVCPYNTLFEIDDDSTVYRQDFGEALIGSDTGHYLMVAVATPFQRICSGTNTYYVYYANNGLDTAFNTLLQLRFDPEIIPLQFNTPISGQNGNDYYFQLGNLEPLQYGLITITDSISCNAVLGQAACVKADINPLPDTIPTGSNWDGSSITVDQKVNASNDTIYFYIKNTGTGNMADSSHFRIYEDDILIASYKFKVGVGDSLKQPVVANGKTFRLEADQRPGHPGMSRPRQFVELAGNPPYSLHHIVPVGQDDLDDWLDIDCHEIVGSFDPNDKMVFPSGVGEEHYITPEDLELTYQIRFQNTGTDTAFNIWVIDTIDIRYLDINTLSSLVASAYFELQVQPNGVVRWWFPSIMLPDSNVNEPESHGFLQFTIKQKPNLLPGTRIENFADIYFDSNAPIRTNTTFLTIETKDKVFPPLVIDGIKSFGNYDIHAYPNPTSSFVTFQLDGLKSKNIKVELTNMLGQEATVPTANRLSEITIDCHSLPIGIYLFRVIDGEQILGVGKLIKQ